MQQTCWAIRAVVVAALPFVLLLNLEGCKNDVAPTEEGRSDASGTSRRGEEEAERGVGGPSTQYMLERLAVEVTGLFVLLVIHSKIQVLVSYTIQYHNNIM